MVAEEVALGIVFGCEVEVDAGEGGMAVLVTVAGGGGGEVTVNVPEFVDNGKALPLASVAVASLNESVDDPAVAPVFTVKLKFAIDPFWIGF